MFANVRPGRGGGCFRGILAALLVLGWAGAGSVRSAEQAADGRPVPVEGAGTHLPPVRVVTLSLGRLEIPAGHRPTNAAPDLWVHLHGAPEVVARNLEGAGWLQPRLNVTLPGLSSVYRRAFAEPGSLIRLLDEARAAFSRETGHPAPAWGRVAVSSFSAGFGGVREMLKHEPSFARIDALVLADSLYAGYAGDPAERRVDPELMAGFLRYAREAVAGRKQMVVSFCQLRPEGYASTGETAAYLVRETGLETTTCREEWVSGWICLSRAAKGELRLLGFAGDQAEDHLKHLRNLGRLVPAGWASTRAGREPRP